MLGSCLNCIMRPLFNVPGEGSFPFIMGIISGYPTGAKIVSRLKNDEILTPVEAERLNQFPDNWTNTGMTSKKRYFMMGNALVCGIIKELGYKIKEIIEQEN